jgi:hypothetical protein
VDARIDQDPEISPRLTLWNQMGSQVIRGQLRVIPVDGSILYVEPLYLQATETRLPELKRVLVVYGDKVAMEETLEMALNVIFGAAVMPSTQEKPASAQSAGDLAARAYALYLEAQQKSQAGDWAGYGKAIKDLGETLKELDGRMRGRR